MERRKRLDELILMAQAGDEEAFANMILYIKDDLYKLPKQELPMKQI